MDSSTLATRASTRNDVTLNFSTEHLRLCHIFTYNALRLCICSQAVGTSTADSGATDPACIGKTSAFFVGVAVMARIAIDVVLLPSQAIAETAIKANRQLPARSGDRIILDKENCLPHITIGYGELSHFLFPEEFTASKLALCHLGNHCTCRRVLASFALPGAGPSVFDPKSGIV